MRRFLMYGVSFAWLTALFLVFAPLALLWPTLAWRNRLSLLAGRLWGEVCLGAAGVRVEYRGLRHLLQPAILTFNHTSYLDYFFNAPLAGARCLVFGKRELARIPGLGWGWYLGGHPLIQREDRAQWELELARTVALMRDRGYSTIIAPEGRRSRTGELLPFKKGVVHLAIDTGLPIVPVVIRGGGELMRGVPVPRSGKAVVELLPPVSTAGWSRETVDLHLADLRAVYEQALAPAPLVEPAAAAPLSAVGS